MQCPNCRSTDTNVIDSRDVDPMNIRRRRECPQCHFRFTTYEKFEPIKIMVIKRSGTYEPFDRSKLIKGMNIAAKDRVPSSEIEATAIRIEQRILQRGESHVPSRYIGDQAIKELRELDEIAYLRFASVYKNFKTVKSFEKELEKIKR